MPEYLACGNIMMDVIESNDGTFSHPSLGGPAFFALEGIRLFTEDCALVCQAGADFESTYSHWMQRNTVSEQYVRISADHCSQHILKYNEDGSGNFTCRSRYGEELLGYLKTTPEHIDVAAHGTKGIYLAQNTDKVFWSKLDKVKHRHGFKMMWEIEATTIEEDLMDRAREVIHLADMWSVNLNEATGLFKIPIQNEEDILNEIMKLPVELTLLRVGARGAYTVTGNTAVFCEAIDITDTVDPTGCGNCSTAAAMYAHVAGYEPRMVVAMANVAAGYNAAQFGVYPHITSEVMKDALALATSFSEKIM